MDHQRFTTTVTCLLVLVLFASGCATNKVSSLNQVFAPFPSCQPRQKPILPTDNENILDDRMDCYVACTGTNPNYGMPGWSRNGGTRFHKGVDIKPVSSVPTQQKIKVERKDQVTGQFCSCWQTVRVPKDKIYAILDGVVVVTSSDPSRSGYGKYVMIEHAWSDGAPFLTLYAHLSSINVHIGQSISQGTTIGIMGQTAGDAGSRQFLLASPHMHFEVGRLIDPEGGGWANRYDPRNMQPYQPIEFLKRYSSMSHREWAAQKPLHVPVLATVGVH